MEVTWIELLRGEANTKGTKANVEVTKIADLQDLRPPSAGCFRRTCRRY